MERVFFFSFFLSLIEIFSCEFRLLRPALGPFCSGRRSNASFSALRRSGFQINFRLGCLFFFFFSDMGIQLFWQYLSKGLNFSRASQMPGLNVDWPGQSRLRTAVILLHAAHATRTAPLRSGASPRVRRSGALSALTISCLVAIPWASTSMLESTFCGIEIEIVLKIQVT